MQEAEHHGDRWFKDTTEQAERRARIESTLALLKQASREVGTPIGATDSFPQGAMTPDDEGQIRMAITAQHGKVILAFGKAVQWIGFSPREARELANGLNKWADKA